MTSDTDTVSEVIVVPRCCCNSYTAKNVSSCSSNLDLMVSQHPKLKSGHPLSEKLVGGVVFASPACLGGRENTGTK